MATYGRQEVLVDTQWVADHSKDPKIRVFEVSVDQGAFDQGHIPGAVALNWFHDLEERPHRLESRPSASPVVRLRMAGSWEILLGLVQQLGGTLATETEVQRRSSSPWPS